MAGMDFGGRAGGLLVVFLAGCGAPQPLSAVGVEQWEALCAGWATVLVEDGEGASCGAIVGLFDDNNCPSLAQWQTCDLTVEGVDDCVHDLAAANASATGDTACPTYGSVPSCAGVDACADAEGT